MGKSILFKLMNFFREGIWRIRLKDLPPGKSVMLRYLKVVLLSSEGFLKHNCDLRASALTFYTTLSVVPVAAMLFGVAKGFGYENKLKAELYQRFAGQEEVLDKIVVFADSFLENTKGGMIAGVGVAVLFWTVVSILSNIESSFNAIWGVRKSRALIRKLTDYLSLMLICPLLVLIASSATVFITTKLTSLSGEIPLSESLSPAIIIMARLLPVLVIWILFSFIYIFLPNTKVNLKSGIIAGLAAGILYQVLQESYIFIQVALSKYNAVYGSFSALPLFLIWLRMSWLIVLFGAEVSFADQNVKNTEYERDAMKVSYSYKILLTLWTVSFLVKKFCRGEMAPTDIEITDVLGIPIRLTREIIYDLSNAKIISEVVMEHNECIRYQPGVSIEHLSLTYVMEAINANGDSDAFPVSEDQSLNSISESLKEFKSELARSPANVLLKDI